MYKEYKQWKRFLAHPLALFIYGLSFYVIATIAVNALLGISLNLIHEVQNGDNGMKGYIEGTFATVTGEDKAQTPLFQWSYLWTFHPQYPFVYLFVYFILSIFVFKKVYVRRIAFRNVLLGLKGTMRWTTMDEIKQQYHRVKTDHSSYEGRAGIPILHFDGFIYMDINKTNTLVDASTQSGKTETFTYPFLDIIMRASIKDSTVILDVKGNILKRTKAEFERFGFLVRVFNLLDVDKSMGYNPLELIRKAFWKGDISKAQTLAQTLSFSFYNNPEAKDPLWQKASITLLNALILAVCDECKKANTPEKVTLFTVAMMLQQLAKNPDEDGLTPLDYYFDNLPDLHPAKRAFATIEFSQKLTRSSIYTGTISELQKYMMDDVAKLTARNDFDFEELTEGDKPVALFVIVKDWDDSLSDLVSSFLSQESAVLSELAVRSASSSLSRRVHHVYEELGNIPRIPNLARYMGVGLERGLIYHLIIQSIPKLKALYGEQEAEDMMYLCGNWIYIMSEAKSDADLFSEKLGNASVISPRRDGDPMSDDKSYGEQEDSRELMKPEELTKLVEGERIVLRTKKRRDLKGKKVRPYPIFASDEKGMAMLHRYEYLLDYFDNPVTFDQLGIENDLQEMKLENLMLHFSLPSDSSEKPEAKENHTERSGFHLDKIDEIFHTETPIEDVLTPDQYRLICSIVQDNTTEETYRYFCDFETIEEIKNFMMLPEREDVFDQVGYLLEKEGA